jgi:thiamine pyrophosphokinase
LGVCYIVGAGDFYGEINPSEDDLVIAADGGYNALISHGVRVDLLIGDLDSLTEAPIGVEILRFPPVKDETDSFLAYSEGVRRGYTDFRLYGCVGGREDHTYANYSLLLYARRRSHRAYLYAKDGVSFVLANEGAVLKGEVGKYFSLFALSASAEGVFVKGAKYSTEGVTLHSDFPLGVSNEFLGSDTRVFVKKGELLVMAQTLITPSFFD